MTPEDKTTKVPDAVQTIAETDTITKDVLNKELPEVNFKPFASDFPKILPGDGKDTLDIQKSEMKDAESKGLTWKFEGETYPLFLANKTGNIAMPIPHPNTNEKMGVLGANFAWEQAEPFLLHLNIDLKEISNLKEEGLSTTKRKNLTQQNVNLFTKLIQDGFLIKIKDGEESEPINKEKDAMLLYPPEIQSDLIDKWLGSFYIERYFPEGFDELDALLGQTDRIHFKCKIGDVKNPAHVLVLGFAKPDEVARRDFEDKVRKREYKQEGDIQTTYITINHKVKFNYAKNHLREVQGAVVEEKVDGGAMAVKNIDSKDGLKLFRDGFCPQWFIRLGDALHDTFGIKK